MCAADRLCDIRDKAMEYDVIGIDEGQFVSSIWITKGVPSMPENSLHTFAMIYESRIGEG